MAKKTSAAPIRINKAIKPRRAGRLNVTLGSLLAWTDLDEREDVSGVERSVPQTRQRGASSGNRVPQVGHIFVFLGVFSRLISDDYTMQAGVILHL